MKKPVERLLKACAVVVRKSAGQLECLVFQHPRAGVQLVKGTVEQGETAATAAQRELLEESGLIPKGKPLDLGVSDGIEPGERWHFFLFSTASLPDEFSHFCDDDGGHQLSFFWQGFDEYVEGNWNPKFIRALRHIENKLEKLPADVLNRMADASDEGLATSILKLVEERGAGKSVCPSEVARHLAGDNTQDWRQLMKPVRAEAVRLAKAGKLVITRKKVPVDPDNFKGVYRLTKS